MTELMRQYYIGERALSLPAFIAGGAVLLIALLCLKHATNPVAKGMGTGLLIVCALLVALAISARIFNGKKLETLPDPNTTTEISLQQSELLRMNKVMNVTFHYAFIAFAVLAAMLAIMLIKSDYWRGMAIALMVLVALATIADSFNSRRNRLYLEAVQAYQPN